MDNKGVMIIKIVVFLIVAVIYVALMALSAMTIAALFFFIITLIFSGQLAETIFTWIGMVIASVVFIIMMVFGIRTAKDEYINVAEKTDRFLEKTKSFWKRCHRKKHKRKATVSSAKIKNENTRRNRMDKPKNDNLESSVEMEVVQIEERVCSVMELLDNAAATKTAWQNYKGKKHIRRANENLQELSEMLVTFTRATKSAVEAAEAQNDLTILEINRRRLAEVESLRNDVEVEKLKALKVRHKVNRVKDEQTIERLTDPPAPPPIPKSRSEQEAGRKERKEAEEDKRDAMVEKWRKELLDNQSFDNEDIETEIERRKRARGWLDNI